MTIEKTWNTILEYDIATEKELMLVTSILGYNKGILNKIIYARTGYRTIEQFIEQYQDVES